MKFRNKLTRLKKGIARKATFTADLIEYATMGILMSGIVYLLVVKNAIRRGKECESD